MRARNIKAGFFANDDIADLPVMARLLYIGLWCYADRDGFFEWKPRKIKAAIFPYDSVKIDDYLTKMMDNGSLWQYVITFNDNGNTSNVTFGYLPKFKDHQRPHPHEAKSKIFPIVEKAQQNQCDDMSCHLIKCTSDIMIVDIRKEDIRKEEKVAFEDFYSLYPRKTQRANAESSWDKLSFQEQQDSIASLPLHISSEQWQDKKFIPHPATWLNQKRWQDEVEPASVGGNTLTGEALEAKCKATAARLFKSRSEPGSSSHPLVHKYYQELVDA